MINIHSVDRWNKSRLSSLFLENTKKNSEFSEKRAFQFFFGNIVPKKDYELTEDLIETYKKYTVVQPGDIMINGLNLNYDFVTQRVGLVKDNGIITSAYLSLRARSVDINNRYYCYLLKAVDAQKIFHGLGTGIRLTLSFNDIKKLMIPVPPCDEQDQIVRYLDWKVSEINRLIKAKRKEIKALKDLKNTMINNTTTRGLDQITRVKSSGEKWLGNIPEHWETKKIKHVFFERSEKGYPNEQLLVASQSMGVVPKNIYGNRTVEPQKDLHLLKLVKKGDFVISLRSFQGGIELAHYQGIISPAYTIMIRGIQITEGYAKVLFKAESFMGLLKHCVTGIRDGQNIDYGKLKNHKIPLPPCEEQDEIARFVDNKANEISHLIEIKTNEINLFENMKNSFISDVVTGKIDVRGIEIPEYEFVEEDDFDETNEASEQDATGDAEE